VKISKPKIKSWIVRCLALGLGVFLSFQSIQKSPPSLWEEGSFFVVSNPGSPSIGDVLLSTIEAAKSAIEMQIYALSDKKIIQTLKTKSALIPIHIYYDPKASLDLSKKLGPQILTTAAKTHALMHRKITLVDVDQVLVGSANYTPSSLYWHYNILFGIRSKILLDFLKKNERGSQEFEQGLCFLLPDYKNRALFALIREIDKAQSSLKLAMFSLSHPSILHALEKAAKRGVDISLYIDKLNLTKPSEPLKQFIAQCRKVYTQNSPVLLHHKLCLIDNRLVIGGSANWTKSGFKKNEETLFIFDHLNYEQIKRINQIFIDLEQNLIPVGEPKNAA